MKLRLRSGGDGAPDRDHARHDVSVRQHNTEQTSARLSTYAADNRPAETTGDRLTSAVHEAIEYERAERTTLQLRTQEGDTIRLKFMAVDSISAQTSHVDDGERVVSELQFDAHSSLRFKVVIKGDINAEEQKAIEDVIAQASELANTFYSGDVAGAFAAASDFQINSEQLARVNLRFSVQERYAFAQSVVTTRPAAELVEQTQAVAATEPVAPVATSVEAVPAQAQIPVAATSPVASEPAVEVDATPQPDVGDAVDHLASALTAITDFLTQLTESLEAFTESIETPSGSSAFTFSYGFKLQMMSTMISTFEHNKSDEQFMDGHDLAAETLSELAAQQDASLDVSV